MKAAKRLMIAACTIGAISQSSPPVQAQAIPGTLEQMAMSAAPILLPLAATVLVTGARVGFHTCRIGLTAGLMVPYAVKDKVSNMSMPRFRHNRAVASTDTATGAHRETTSAESSAPAALAPASAAAVPMSSSAAVTAPAPVAAASVPVSTDAPAPVTATSVKVDSSPSQRASFAVSGEVLKPTEVPEEEDVVYEANPAEFGSPVVAKRRRRSE